MKCFHLSGCERGGYDGDGVLTVPRIGRFSLSRSQSVASSTSEAKLSAPNSGGSGAGPFSGRELGRRLEELRVFGIDELRAATKGFSRALVIGEGGFGCVYRGVIRVPGDKDGKTMDVAVKQLSKGGTQGIQRLLVYELMRNKSLDDHLLSRVSTILPWPLRLKVALGAARGLAYLHEGMESQLIFRDFKTSNILLDKDFNAKLSDFGLVREGPIEDDGHVSTALPLTFCIPLFSCPGCGHHRLCGPRVPRDGRLTSKSDVWSFGVVLYELITGRRSLDRNLPKSEQKLLRWVRPYAADPKKFHLIVDPRLAGEYCTKSAQALAALADRCLQRQPRSRPKMSEVVEILTGIIEASDVDFSVAPGRGGAAAASAAAEPSSQRQAYSVGESTPHRARSSTPFLYRSWWTMGLFDACRPAH
ncbi:unnamed protein product [Spirodela intermedia]|uniref:Protein kinase domain-containing protein n=1 Tax=Spirodela intermedia TaxID=51605 RepID=A0A7I8IB91_SPIIN|nr:unnamed protein product [Spirodela intermedia]CAA6654985.1 unnamed protein product [Spirodela intermedia]